MSSWWGETGWKHCATFITQINIGVRTPLYGSRTNFWWPNPRTRVSYPFVSLVDLSMYEGSTFCLMVEQRIVPLKVLGLLKKHKISWFREEFPQTGWQSTPRSTMQSSEEIWRKQGISSKGFLMGWVNVKYAGRFTEGGIMMGVFAARSGSREKISVQLWIGREVN